MDSINALLFEGLNEEQLQILRDQIERFLKLKGNARKSIIVDDKIIFPEGTLIHGTPFNKKNLQNIARSGIVSGQALGIYEDGETFCCADFHRIPKNITLEEYNRWFPYNDGRCPFGSRGNRTLAFVIHPDSSLENLVSYDCYREKTEESEKTKTFVNEKGLPSRLRDNKEYASSILFGVPSCFINGIILGDRNITVENVDFLIETFPGVYIARNNGRIIYKPGYSREKTELIIENIQKDIELREKERQISEQSISISNSAKIINDLWKAISILPKEAIIEVYQLLNYQGNLEIMAENLKLRYSMLEQKDITK